MDLPYVIDKVIELGGKVNDMSTDFPPIICAAMHGSLKATSRLIKKGADVNLCGLWGKRTALDLAVARSDEKLTRILLEADANKKWASYYVESHNQNESIANALLDHGAEVSKDSGYLKGIESKRKASLERLRPRKRPHTE